MSESARTVCPGCFQAFGDSHGAFFRHLRTTTNSACVCYREERLSYRSPSPQGDSDRDFEPAHSRSGENVSQEPSHERTESPDPQPVPFEGDYFGEYTQDDLDDFDEYAGPPDEDDIFDDPSGDESSDDDYDDNGDWSDEEDANHLEEEHSWEPRAPTPPIPTSPVDPSPSEDAHATENPRTHQGARHTAEGNLRTRTHVVPYPHLDAGARVPADTCATSNEEYASRLGDSVANAYAPFVSELDWEFARWAKMCGPGSTAVTELLKIRGVSVGRGVSQKVAVTYPSVSLQLPSDCPTKLHNNSTPSSTSI